MEEKKGVNEEEKRVIENNIKRTQKKEHKKILGGFLLILGVIVIAFIAWMVISKSVSSFEYKGVEFDIVEEIAPYRTSVPVIVGSGITGAATGTQTQYYFYLRNDPRALDKIEFDGEIKLLKNIAAKSEKDFNCDGNGAIGMINLVRLYQLMGSKVIKDEEAECDEEGRYMVWSFVEAEKTEIEEVSPACYEIRVNNCEILEATEKFMIETLVELNKGL